MLAETLFWGEKTKNKKLVANLLELIQVSMMMKIMKLVEYKHLSVNLNIKNLKN